MPTSENSVNAKFSIAPPRSARAAGEGMLTSAGIMRPPQGPERKRAWGVRTRQSEGPEPLTLVLWEPRPYERSRCAEHSGRCNSVTEVCPPHRG